jgi:autotransporter-associated beta strand protein
MVSEMNTRLSRFAYLFQAFSLLASASAFAVNSTWTGGAAGNWNDPANWSAGVPQAASDTATLNAPVAIAVSASVTVKTLTVNAPATLTVASGATLAFSNSGGDVIVANANCLIDGAGDIALSMNGTSGLDYANIKPVSGVTLTFAARVAASGNAGVELNGAGTLLLTNPNNAFTGLTRISVGNATFAFSDPAALGPNAVQFDGNLSKLVYTGTAPATLAIPIRLNVANATFENAGAGTLTLSGAIAPISAGAKTLTFQGTAQTNILTGTLSNDAGSLNITLGTGTLVLNGALTTGTVTASSGGTLAIGSGATFQSGTLACSAGSLLALNPAAADGFTATLPPTSTLNGAGVRLVLPAAANASTVTLPALVRAGSDATLDVVADALGTPRNTLLIQNLTPGPLPVWFTVNGQPATYDATLGVVPATASGPTVPLTALGPATVPNNATAAAVIDDAGTSGGITLAADPTTVFSLTQAHAADPATIDLGGQTLAASVVAITAAGNSLTLTNGTLSAPSAQTPPSGTVVFPTLDTLPIAWFDLADADTVITNDAGRITLLANKGSRGAALDAVVPAGRIGPRYIPAAVNGLGVARSDGISPPQALATLGNTGITGNAPRTAFLVVSRSPVSRNNFYALYLGPDGGGNQDFCICERTDRTSFSTKSNDLEGFPASPVGHNVLTFTTGLDGTPNAGAGFRNGVLLGTKTFALATIDAPIHLLHRPNPAANVSGPGDVAEALVFDVALSETDRAAVEAYLMQKWRIAAQRDDVLLALRNDNPAAELAVPAAVAESYGTLLSLAKSGPGDVVLGGPLAFGGTVLINEGTLVLDIPADGAAVLAAPVSGPGALVKTGAGSLSLALSSPYAGGTTIRGGTLYSGVNGSLGLGAVRIEAGGTLDILNGTTAIANPVSVEGAGPDGLGALRNSSPNLGQQNAFKGITLTGDTAVYPVSRFDTRDGAFDFGGHSLTVNGTGEFSIVRAAVSNVTHAAAIHVADGVIRLEQSDFLGTDSNLVSTAPGAGVCLYQMTVPMQWSLALADNAFFRVNNGAMDTNLNRWAGPVTLAPGTARLTALTGGTAALTGAVGGDGGLLKEGDGWFWLFNPANTYAGATAVAQGNLYAAAPGSIGTGPLTVSGSGSFIARAGTDAWSMADIEAIADASVFTAPTASLGIDTLYEDFDYTAAFPYLGLKKLGPRTLTLSGGAPELGPLSVYDGHIDLTGTGPHDLHGNSALIGTYPATSALASLTLADAALLIDDPGFNRTGGILGVGYAGNARGILRIGENALVRGHLRVGYSAGDAGAVYQTSGVVTNIGGNGNEARIGGSGYGYYRIDSGELATKGQFHFGLESGSTGILDQRGGSVILNPGSAPAAGEIGDYYNGSFTTRGGVGIFQLSGGTFTTSGHTLNLGEWANQNNYSNGTAILTVENGAQALVDAEIGLARRKGSAEAYVNLLSGGVLATRHFLNGSTNKAPNTVKTAVAFNGGTLRLLETGNPFRTSNETYTPTRLNVYAGGAIRDVTNNVTATLDLPLDAPASSGVTAVNVTSPGTGYIAPPAVLFGGACTAQATAFAEIDPAAGTLTAIRVTSPGAGYTAAPTVTLRGGGAVATATATAAIAPSASGGLTKLGIGILTLNAANTYTGPTVVSNGILRLGSAGSQALTPNTHITLAGGTLDLGGATLINNHVVTLESGTLSGGAISAQGFAKTGPGTATLDAAAIPASAEALFQGYIASLAPLLWYDPSDAPTVTLDASGRVTALANKGTRGAEMNAVAGATPQVANAPLLATGALSYAASRLPMLKIDGNERGLGTAANLGITGSSPRTVVAVFTRESDTTAAYLCFGAAATSQMWEIGDRENSSKCVIGGFGGYDLAMDPQNPAQQANIVVAQLSAPNTSEAWRTGTGQNYKTFTAPGAFNTADSPFLIGNRVGASKASGARGQIGEVLVFDRVLSVDERETLMAMLQQKWLSTEPPDAPEIPAAILFTIAEGTLRLAPGADTVAAMAPAVWYDPSDATTVTLDGNGRVTALANKGARGTAMDAGLRSGFQGPPLAAGTESYAASGLPMLKIDSDSPGTGLESASNTGISGTMPRTLVAVLSRPATPASVLAVVACGSQTATRNLFELSDRSTGADYGNNGDDLSISPIEPACIANVYMHEATAPNVATGYRSTYPYVVSKTLAGNWATTDSKLCVGYRPGGHRADMRGQIGEVLLFDRLLSPAERADLENYLVAKWTRAGGSDEHLYDNAVFDVAAEATLNLGGARVNITVTGSGTVTNGVLGADFVISPAGDDAVGALALRGVTITAGAVYRLTIDGDACDRLLIDGDLSALTVIPAINAEITGRSYVIATGAITHKPALSGFPEKFKLIQQGDDLLLTSVGGTMILLK